MSYLNYVCHNPTLRMSLGELIYNLFEFILTGPDPDTLPGSPGWSRLVKFHCTIPREDTVELHFKEGSKHMH